ncbi:proline racemase family protein [Microbacterium sp. MPKO10]|uniref:proline racemase family protein n=1 Tax=Microbacterium sp. MPKO10 TaxID=2989818 RepID=UPI0022363855|nr:proline racemase family protein [Microbacterium sp. MPKO10]MCW4459976.1 proline racemase family protein [Microbacterium sp. MPKO10]
MTPVSTVDYHTAGEPFRIVADADAALRGDEATDAAPSDGADANSALAGDAAVDAAANAVLARDAATDAALAGDTSAQRGARAGQPLSRAVSIVTDSHLTVAERRIRAMAPASPLDDLRRILCFEPRGHADMYGGFIVPPDDDGAHFGVLFWHKELLRQHPSRRRPPPRARMPSR